MKINTKSLSRRSDLHLLRKIWHIACGVGALYIYYSSGLELVEWGKVAIIISLAGFALDFIRLKNKSFNKFALKLLGPLMRKSEADSFSGLPFYALGVGLSILLYQDDIALLSIMFLVFADPIASLIGIRYGKDKIMPNKSLQGTIACFLICYIITMIRTMDMNTSSVNILVFAVLAGMIGALSEIMSAFNIDDNLTIPVISGAGLTVLNIFFNLF